MAGKKEMSKAKAKAIAEFEGDDSPLTIAERYLHKAKEEVSQLDICSTKERKIRGHITAAWVKLMEMERSVESNVLGIQESLRIIDRSEDEDVRYESDGAFNLCKRILSDIKTYEETYSDNGKREFIQANIQKAWFLFLKEYEDECIADFIDSCDLTEKEARKFCNREVSSLYSMTPHKGRGLYADSIVFLAYSREQRDEIANVESEASEFFKKYFNRDIPILTQAEYIRSECPSAYMAYC